MWSVPLGKVSWSESGGSHSKNRKTKEDEPLARQEVKEPFGNHETRANTQSPREALAVTPLVKRLARQH